VSDTQAASCTWNSLPETGKVPIHIEALNQITPYLIIVAQAAGVLAIAALAIFGIKAVRSLPVSIRVDTPDGVIDYAPFLKMVVNLLLLALACGHGCIVIFLPLLTAAKIFLIELLIISSLGCWVGIANSGRWARQLMALQAECELATNLTFLQGEMIRAQLEEANERIHRQLEPPAMEASETLLKSLQPVMMLFLQKEKSIMKWSMAAVNVGKNLTKYFSSPKK
jgi:hypothetical protein